MAKPTPRVVYVLLVPIAVLCCIGGSTARWADLRDACRETRHRSLCFRSLAPFTNQAKQAPHWWARAAVSVSIAETKKVGLYLSDLKKSGRMRGKARYALSDCMECLNNALDELHGALGELRRLRAASFGWQISNVETWVSAALTDADTCLDGFSSVRAPQARALCGKVQNVTDFTSNALALVNKLAATSRP